MGWLSDRREKTKNYTKHPLDEGLGIVSFGALVPFIALMRFPMITGHRQNGSVKVYAIDYDPVVLVVLPVVVLALALAFRFTRKAWCYWTLIVLSVVYAAFYILNLVLAIASGDAGALDDVNRLAAIDGVPLFIGASWGYISLSAVAIGSIVVLAGCWYFRQGRKELAA